MQIEVNRLGQFALLADRLHGRSFGDVSAEPQTRPIIDAEMVLIILESAEGLQGRGELQSLFDSPLFLFFALGDLL